MATVLRSKLSTLLLAIRDQLVAKDIFNKDQAKLSLRMNPPMMALQSDAYAIALPLTFTANQMMAMGGGRQTPVVTGRVNVYPRISTNLDTPYGAEAWLTDPSLGILDKVHGIVDALHMFEPTDDSKPTGNIIVAEPMRLVFWGEPKQRYQSSWGDVVVEFELCYALDLDQSWQ